MIFRSTETLNVDLLCDENSCLLTLSTTTMLTSWSFWNICFWPFVRRNICPPFGEWNICLSAFSATEIFACRLCATEIFVGRPFVQIRYRYLLVDPKNCWNKYKSSFYSIEIFAVRIFDTIFACRPFVPLKYLLVDFFCD